MNYFGQYIVRLYHGGIELVDSSVIHRGLIIE